MAQLSAIANVKWSRSNFLAICLYKQGPVSDRVLAAICLYKQGPVSDRVLAAALETTLGEGYQNRAPSPLEPRWFF